MIPLTLQSIVQCSKCSESFEFSFSTDLVFARIAEGGSVELEWPRPELPEGWGRGAHGYSGPFCPAHQAAEEAEYAKRIEQIEKEERERKEKNRRKRRESGR